MRAVVRPVSGATVTSSVRDSPRQWANARSRRSTSKHTPSRRTRTSRPGPTILEGATVNWFYYVINSGEQPLYNITVTDDQGVTVSCPWTTLLPQDTMVCTASGTAATGQYSNVGTVVAYPPYDPHCVG